VRHQALRLLADETDDAPVVRRALGAAMRAAPMAAILEAQDAAGFWVKPGSGYGPKYTGTVWSLMFLDQLGADPRDRRIARACAYVLGNAQAPNGGFGWSGTNSTVVHCLNGNLLRALLGFGWLDDERVRAAIDWEARSITGEGFEGYHPWATSGPGFACGINGRLPCGWGAVKAMGGLARVPPRRRTAPVRAALRDGASFLLSRDPAHADYPTDSKVSRRWFQLGFPSGYVADVLQLLEVLAETGHARDPRLGRAIDLVLGKQDDRGRWRNEFAYARKTWGEIERQGAPSKWVTLRACVVLRAALG
jgi:hypothetical protein